MRLERRRAKQIAFNAENNITPSSINKKIKDIIDGVYNPQEAQDERKVAQEQGSTKR